VYVQSGLSELDQPGKVFVGVHKIGGIIKSLMPYNTCGCDEIPSNLLKIRSVTICSCLNRVCHKSLL